jgi:sugar-specific transcriptional regulator TrmB
VPTRFGRHLSRLRSHTRTSALDALKDLLVDQGLPDSSARVYVAAARAGPQSASELASGASIPRVEAYRCIRQLIDRGFMRQIKGRPAQFKALPIGALLDRYERTATERFSALRANVREVRSEIRDHGFQYSEVEIGPRLRLLSGKAAYEAVQLRVAAARKVVVATVPEQSLPWLLRSPMMRAYGSARDHGATVYLLTHLTRVSAPHVKGFGSGIELRHMSTPLWSPASVVDREWASLLITEQDIARQSRESAVMIVSTARSFVRAIGTYLEQALAKSVPSEERVRDFSRIGARGVAQTDSSPTDLPRLVV